MTNVGARRAAVAVLQDLYRRVGSPGYEVVAKHATGPGESLSKSTVGNVLNCKNTRSPTIRVFVNACLRHAGKHPQLVALSKEQYDEKYWLSRYESATATDEPPGDLWTRLVRNHVAWQRVDPAEDPAPFREHAVFMARRLFQIHQDAEDLVAEDPWRDPDLADRITRGVEGLIKTMPDLILSPAEAALLAVAPLAYQTTIVKHVALKIGVGPTCLDTRSQPHDDRAEYERFLRPEPRRRLVSRAGLGTLPDRRQAVKEIGWWLFHGWLASDPQLSVNPVVNDLLNAPAMAESAVQKTLVETLGRVLRMLRLRPDELNNADRHRLSEDYTYFAMSSHPQRVREQLIGLFLVIAHVFAIEIVKLSSTVVEHLGIPDPVDLDQLRATVLEASWGKLSGPDRMELKASCHHEAVWEALREHVAYVGAVLDSVHTASIDNKKLQHLQTLPARVSADQVAPALSQDGQSAFETPVNRFRLDEGRVRELLMGQQLYRDPALAIRELYQNAVDACRYRKARHDCRAKKEGPHFAWEGKITFEQGVDHGRHYLQCSDNGIGMSFVDLRDVFSKAGVRFTDSAEFQEEKAEWDAEGVEHYPISRFGIGVMSYFMLADEIEVTTRRMGWGDRPPGPVLKVTIVGPGHMFRIKPSLEQREPGTQVRLYLRDGADAPSCVETLCRLLGIAEFATTAEHEKHGVSETWRPNELKWRARPAWEQDGIDVHGKLVPGHPCETGQAIWCEHGGALLANGIYVQPSIKVGVLADPQGHGDPRGVVVNLTRKWAPELSVDRRLVLEDVSRKVEQLLSGATNNLIQAAPDFLRFEWICDLVDNSPGVADLVTAATIEHAYRLRLGDMTLNAAVTGCFPSDPDLIAPDRDTSRDWQAETHRRGTDPSSDPRETIDQMPDHLVLWRLLAHRAHDHQHQTNKLADELADIVPELRSDTQVLPALPSDTALAASFELPYRDDESDVDAPPPPGYLISIAVATGMSPHKAAQRTVALGARNLHPERFSPYLLGHTVERALLSHHLDGNWPWLSTSEPVLFGHFLDARRRLKISCSEAASKLAGFGFDVAQAEMLPDRPTLIDMKLLSHLLNGQEPWLDASKPVAPAHLNRAAQELGCSSREVADRLRAFELTVPFPEGLPCQPTADDLILLSTGLDGDGPWLDEYKPVRFGHVLKASKKFGCTLREVATRLNIYYMSAHLPSGIPDRPSKQDLKLLDMVDDRDDSHDDFSVPLHVLIRASRDLELSPQQVAEQLNAWGFTATVPEHLPREPSTHVLRLINRDLNEYGPWLSVETPVVHSHLLKAYAELAYSPREAAEVLRTCGFTVLPFEDPSERRLRLDQKILSKNCDGEPPWLAPNEPVPLQHLFSSSRKTGMSIKAVANRLRESGMKVTDLTETIREAVTRLPRLAHSGHPDATG